MDAAILARACADAMAQDDATSRGLGVEVAVSRDDGTVVAEFRGNGRIIEGTLVPTVGA